LTEERDDLNELGGPPVIGSPADLGKIMADDTEKWARVSGSPAPSRTKQQRLSRVPRV
jgi:hypothetical protein